MGQGTAVVRVHNMATDREPGRGGEGSEGGRRGPLKEDGRGAEGGGLIDEHKQNQQALHDDLRVARHGGYSYQTGGRTNGVGREWEYRVEDGQVYEKSVGRTKIGKGGQRGWGDNSVQ